MPVACRDARPFRRAHRTPSRTRGDALVSRRISLLAALAAAVLGVSAGSPQSVAEFGDTRTISFYHIHTKETLTVTYKRNGKYLPDALKKINWLMRDWRENEEIAIDPKTIDLLWEMHTELRSKEPIHVICGYRSEKTNGMLRRTVGGQAKRSYHIRGQAIDAAFPDVPLKQMRYSALVREMGGVGYYPGSGIPFVHVDSGPVRAWPRLPRRELALLFPSGHTQHKPADGGSLRPSDVAKARKSDTKLAAQVAEYFKLRSTPHTPGELAVAALGPVEAPAPQPAKRPPVRVASLTPPPATPPSQPPTVQPAAIQAAAPPAPPVAAPPRPVTRPVASTAAEPPAIRPSPSQMTASREPPASERARLNQLVSLASLSPSELARTRPPEADRRRLNDLFTTAALDTSPAPARPAAPARAIGEDPSATASPRDAGPALSRGRWVPQPEFDDDHPEEMSYRPFPVAPLLTQSPSADDAALVTLVHPDVARTLDLMDGDEVVIPLRLRPGQQVSEVMWAQQFRGEAVDLSTIEGAESVHKTPTGLASRQVKTTTR